MAVFFVYPSFSDLKLVKAHTYRINPYTLSDQAFWAIITHVRDYYYYYYY
jgi:hypothetical protein